MLEGALPHKECARGSQPGSACGCRQGRQEVAGVLRVLGDIMACCHPLRATRPSSRLPGFVPSSPGPAGLRCPQVPLGPSLAAEAAEGGISPGPAPSVGGAAGTGSQKPVPTAQQGRPGLLSAMMLIHRRDLERREGNPPQHFVPEVSCAQPTRWLSP